jgi:hypothetical protein
MEPTGYVVKWAGGTAYVGCTGKVEGVDGDMWPIGKPMWMLRRMLKHRALEFTIEPQQMCLTGIPTKIKPPNKKKQIKKEAPLVEPDDEQSSSDDGQCKS